MWFGCPHEFSFPIKTGDGSYYQVCTRCGTEYGYDWGRMRRTKPLPRPVQQTSLEQGRPEVPFPCVPEQPKAIARPSGQADIPAAVSSTAEPAERSTAAVRPWNFFNRQRLRITAAFTLALFAGFAYVAVHRSGHAVLQQKNPEAAAPAEVAAHPEHVEATAGNQTAPEIPAPSAASRRVVTKKLKRASAVQRVQTPVLVLGEALLTSQPDGAQVRFDGRSDPVFVTPAVAGSILPGRHSVAFSKAGFVSQTVTVEVVAGARSTVTARLVRQGSAFKVSSNPAGAAILLDGKSTALTSPAELHVDAAGPHTITLLRPGFLPAQSQVSVRDGENFSLEFSLTPAGNAAEARVVGGIKRLLPGGASKQMADVQFKTSPKGARLVLNGWPAPKTTPLELRLPPGGYDVVIEAEGFKTFSKEIVLEAGQKVVLQEALERAAGDERPAKP